MTYKKMIENMIDRHIDRYVKKQSGDCYKLIDIEDIEMDTNSDDISFVARIKVYNTIHTMQYRVSGYVSECGEIHVCLVTYSVFYPNGVDGMNFPQNKMFFVHGDDLKTFKFDK